jgi:hypothetical protein
VLELGDVDADKVTHDKPSFLFCEHDIRLPVSARILVTYKSSRPIQLISILDIQKRRDSFR